MPFELDAPGGLRTDRLVLRPILSSDAEADHEAVMESRELLRVWEQTSWPAEDFTVEENRADLTGLELRHARRQAFTYTVVDPADGTCLGCVYLMPPDARMFDGARITPLAGQAWEDVDAAVYFWVRTSRLAAGTDRLLLAALRAWFADEWDLTRWVFVTHEDLTQQVGLLEAAGLERRFLVEERGKAGRYVAYT